MWIRIIVRINLPNSGASIYLHERIISSSRRLSRNNLLFVIEDAFLLSTFL